MHRGLQQLHRQCCQLIQKMHFQNQKKPKLLLSNPYEAISKLNNLEKFRSSTVSRNNELFIAKIKRGDKSESGSNIR